MTKPIDVHQIVLLHLPGQESPKVMETVSRPYANIYPTNQGTVARGGPDMILARIPGNSVTADLYSIDDMTAAVAICHRDDTVFVPTVVGENSRAHIDCPTCGRGYYAVYSPEFQNCFVADRPLAIIPSVVAPQGEDQIDHDKNAIQDRVARLKNAISGTSYEFHSPRGVFRIWRDSDRKIYSQLKTTEGKLLSPKFEARIDKHNNIKFS